MKSFCCEDDHLTEFFVSSVEINSLFNGLLFIFDHLPNPSFKASYYFKEHSIMTSNRSLKLIMQVLCFRISLPILTEEKSCDFARRCLCLTLFMDIAKTSMQFSVLTLCSTVSFPITSNKHVSKLPFPLVIISSLELDSDFIPFFFDLFIKVFNSYSTFTILKLRNKCVLYHHQK